MQGHAFGPYIYNKLGYRKIAMLAQDFPAGWEQTAATARNFIRLGGRVIQEMYPSIGTADYGPYITQINRDADAVFNFIVGADQVRFVQQYKEFGLKDKIPLITLGIYEEEIHQAQGDASIGNIECGIYSNSIDTPENKRFMQAFKDRYKMMPFMMAVSAYEAAQILVKCLNQLGGQVEKTEQLLEAIKATELPKTPSGSVRFDAYNEVIRDLHVMRVSKDKGKYVHVYLDRIPQVTQFGPWGPEEFMSFPPAKKLKGTWAR
jgi:branched-chain amino acid transport system substrate-binding protein